MLWLNFFILSTSEEEQLHQKHLEKGLGERHRGMTVDCRLFWQVRISPLQSPGGSGDEWLHIVNISYPMYSGDRRLATVTATDWVEICRDILNAVLDIISDEDITKLDIGWHQALSFIRYTVKYRIQSATTNIEPVSCSEESRTVWGFYRIISFINGNVILVAVYFHQLL